MAPGLTIAQPFGILAWALHGTAKLLEARRNRRAIRRLAACEDRMLKDIGLSRSQVMGALEARYDEDPSRLLQQRRWRRPLPGAEPPHPR
ncbi:DUF1127 domain-containing protein [Roseomonas hellenica]|uniref:DUF1127 domain-containing protein n=1 Tax=Plastoroseomonas hellenica TaxID=2687306 RepID=A0ABS5EWF9_9PROT|nr:DUF1127 domain-containing protein [Plastoroseomonas hellenica]MBR0664630.1 DUF1127 domain-containing protein [Plastoroseomonas hellenica]